MGSFNTTCFVSHQSIIRGDKVVILPLIKQKTYDKVALKIKTHDGIINVEHYGYSNSTCYPTAFWGYFGPIIHAKYDDYGRFELENSKSNIINVVKFFNDLVDKICDIKKDENKSNESSFVFSEIYNAKIEYTFNELNQIWNKIWEIFQQSRLFASERNEPQSVAFAVMHEVTAKYLIDSHKNLKNWDKQSLEIKSYFHTYINNQYKKMKEPMDENMASFHQVYMILNTMRLDAFYIGENEGTYIPLYYSTSKDVNHKFANFIKDNPDLKSIPKKFTNELFKDFESQIKHRYIASGLRNLNIKLTPIISADQDCSNLAGNQYLQMIEAINKKVNNLVEDKYGENDD